MEQIWLYYEDGEQKGSTVLTLKRKQTDAAEEKIPAPQEKTEAVS
jgi:hypothetical protein